jgi:hypothetical protein
MVFKRLTIESKTQNESRYHCVCIGFNYCRIIDGSFSFRHFGMAKEIVVKEGKHIVIVICPC